jgi:putative transcriptional regulator
MNPYGEVQVAPGFLLSMPQLADPNFARAVVLMIEHNDAGSFGLIVNRPSNLSVAELLGALDIPWSGDAEQMVLAGGPVQPHSAWIIHEDDLDIPAGQTLESALEQGGALDLGRGLRISSSPERLRELAAAHSARSRYFLGYSGWGPGQLAAEMTQGAWLHAPVDPHLIFDTPAQNMWSAALRTIGVDPESVVPSRGVH